jgi:hypothetical protein
LTVPVCYHISGHIEIEAVNASDAEKKAKELNEVGRDIGSIIDRDDLSEVFFDHIEGRNDAEV